MNTWAFHPIFNFTFWLTKLPKTKIGNVYDVFHLQGKTGKTKMNNNNNNKILHNIFVFCKFCQPKQKTKNGMKMWKLRLCIGFDSIMPFLWFPTSATCMTKRHWDFSSFFKWFLKDVSVCRKYECSGSEPREMVEIPKTTRGFGRNCLACKWTLWKIKSLEILQPERYNKVLEAK